MFAFLRIRLVNHSVIRLRASLFVFPPMGRAHLTLTQLFFTLCLNNPQPRLLQVAVRDRQPVLLVGSQPLPSSTLPLRGLVQHERPAKPAPKHLPGTLPICQDQIIPSPSQVQRVDPVKLSLRAYHSERANIRFQVRKINEPQLTESTCAKPGKAELESIVPVPILRTRKFLPGKIRLPYIKPEQSDLSTWIGL